MGFRRNRLGLRLWWVGIASVCSAASAPSKVRYVKLAALNGPMHLEQALDDHQTIYVSCPSSNSIIAFSPEPSTGRLAFVQSLSDSASPDIYLSGVRATTVSPDGEHLYSVSESESTLMVFHRNPSTGVITFTEEYHKDSVNNDIFLSSPVSLVASLDQSHLYVSAAGGMVMDQSRSAVTCFQWDEKLSESVAVSRVYNGDAGVLGMERSYWVIESPDSKNIYVTSETGVVTFTKEDLTGRLSYLNHMPPLEDGVVPAKIMPREVVVSPDGRHVYAAVMAESHIRAYSRQTEGSSLANPTIGLLTLIDRVKNLPETLNDRQEQEAPAEDVYHLPTKMDGPFGLAMSPRGTFLFVVSPRSNSITVFQRNVETGLLWVIQELTNEDDGLDQLVNPSDIIVGASGEMVYVVAEGNGTAGMDGAILAFDRDIVGGNITLSEVLVNGANVPVRSSAPGHLSPPPIEPTLGPVFTEAPSSTPSPFTPTPSPTDESATTPFPAALVLRANENAASRSMPLICAYAFGVTLLILL